MYINPYQFKTNYINSRSSYQHPLTISSKNILRYGDKMETSSITSHPLVSYQNLTDVNSAWVISR